MMRGICGRTLKGAKSIERGYGPVCYQKIKPKKVKKTVSFENHSILDDMDYNLPGQMELGDFIEMPENEKEKSSD